jgi:oligoribonuclease NrnB/cAMP/cGMP phosphodiesterase (DHH superfamily)
MICFYHNDLDGECSAFIVRNRTGDGIRLQSTNYNLSFRFDLIEKDEVVYIVDFNLQKEGDWDKLLGITPNVTWIDHHQNCNSNIYPQHLCGIRAAGNDGERMAACELVWRYLYNGLDTPIAVQLIGDWDTWSFKFGDKTKDFHYGLQYCYNTTPSSNQLWTLVYSLSGAKEIEWATSVGGKIRRKLDITNASMIIERSFEAEFEGYTILAINYGRSSDMFNSIEENLYPICSCISFDGYLWTVSLYSETVDVSEIARKYGGNGHKGAAGFQCKELPFKIKERK